MSIRPSAFLALILWPALAAQERLPEAEALLREAIAANANLPGVAFQAKHRPDTTMLRQMAAQRAGGAAPETELRGVASGDLLQVSNVALGDELIVHGRRTIAREGAGEWCLRRGRTAGGAPQLWYPDPALLCSALAQVKALPVVQRAGGSLDDRPVEILTVTLEGDAARELIFAGALPDPREGFSFSSVVLRAAGGVRVQMPKEDRVVDLAFFVDPVTRNLMRVRARVAARSQGFALAGGGAAVVQVGGGGQVLQFGGRPQPEAEEDEEAAATQPSPAFEDGLPVRKVDPATDYAHVDLRLAEHGTAKAPELDAKARVLLGLPAAR